MEGILSHYLSLLFLTALLQIGCKHLPESEVKVVNPQIEALDPQLRMSLVSFMIQCPKKPLYSCSGVIVGDKSVLTARHCVVCTHDNRYIKIEPNQVSSFLPEAKSEGSITIESISIHPSKDLGLIRVNGLSKLSNSIPIMPMRAVRIDEPFIVAGYGNVFKNGKKVKIPKNRLNWGRILYRGENPTKELNHGYGAVKDSLEFYGKKDDELYHSNGCHGDSGGGIFIEEGNEYQLAAITSYGPDNCNDLWFGGADPRNESDWMSAP